MVADQSVPAPSMLPSMVSLTPVVTTKLACSTVAVGTPSSIFRYQGMSDARTGDLNGPLPSCAPAKLAKRELYPRSAGSSISFCV